jgi:hypothetical protein
MADHVEVVVGRVGVVGLEGGADHEVCRQECRRQSARLLRVVHDTAVINL